MGRGGEGSLQGPEIAHTISNMPDDTRQGLLVLGRKLFHFVCSHALSLAVLFTAFSYRELLINVYQSGTLQKLWAEAESTMLELTLVQAAAVQAAVILATGLVLYLVRPRKRPTYLIDFYTLRPPNRMAVTKQMLMDGARRPEHNANKAALDFGEKVLEISGLGDATYLPDSVKAGLHGKVEKTMANARIETETVLNVCIEHVLKNTGIKPSQVDALIVHCSAFNPTPSLSAAVVNHFKFKSSIRTFNLSGMGCAASVIAIDLSRDMLANNPNMRIVVAGTENIIMNLYNGQQRSMLITNCIFRLGGVAFMLSNHPADRRMRKYKLKHIVRTHLGASDAAYNSVIQREDPEGKIGVKIGKELMTTASDALKANVTRLAPLVLPVSEQLIFAGNFFARKVLGMKIKPYIPDFTTAFEHFCIHPGGKAVIGEVGKRLKLTPEQCMPMVVPFERYGNTSSASTWYAWTYVETFHKVKRGDRIWQLGFGSGFKCCSAVWVSLRNNSVKHDAWTDTESFT